METSLQETSLEMPSLEMPEEQPVLEGPEAPWPHAWPCGTARGSRVLKTSSSSCSVVMGQTAANQTCWMLGCPAWETADLQTCQVLLCEHVLGSAPGLDRRLVADHRRCWPLWLLSLCCRIRVPGDDLCIRPRLSPLEPKDSSLWLAITDRRSHEAADRRVTHSRPHASILRR